MIDESKKFLQFLAILLIAISLIYVCLVAYTSLAEETLETTVEQLHKWENQEDASENNQSVNQNSVSDSPSTKTEQSTELVISDNAADTMLITICVLAFGAVALAAILYMREKTRREQEYTKTILETPLEQFSSLEVNQLKNKYKEL